MFRTFTRQPVSYPADTNIERMMTPVADLATTIPTVENGGVSRDRRTWAFHLRRDVRWNTSPPRPVVAADVVRAFKMLCNPVSPVGAPGYYVPNIGGMQTYCSGFSRIESTPQAIRNWIESHEIAGVSAPDDTTFVLRLVRPTPDLLSVLAMPFVSPVPSEYLDYLPDGADWRQHTLSNGPHAIARYVPNREYLLVRNPGMGGNVGPVARRLGRHHRVPDRAECSERHRAGARRGGGSFAAHVDYVGPSRPRPEQ
jgi:ABC-type transport system substrate-binding protein